MSELYKNIRAICDEKKITDTELCKLAGIPRSTMTDLKSNRQKDLTSAKIQKIAAALGVSVEELRGEAEIKNGPAEETGKPKVTKDDLKFALFGSADISDELYERVVYFAKIAEREERERNKK